MKNVNLQHYFILDCYEMFQFFAGSLSRIYYSMICISKNISSLEEMWRRPSYYGRRREYCLHRAIILNLELGELL